MALYALGDLVPTIDPTAFVHPEAVIIGNVTVGPESSIWPGAVLRGDHGAIRIGAQTSIQDGSILHCTKENHTIIGDRCVVGHAAHIEGATVEDDALIGSGSILMHRVIVRSRAIVAAGAVVTNDTEVPGRALAMGVPAKIKLDAVEIGAFDWNVNMYIHNSHWYRKDLRRLD